jgi:AGZA family xanthine/uracil permease-like MFS transporter
MSPFYDFLEDFFECIRAGSTVEVEVFAGIINFFSCMYILAVIPSQMQKAGYDSERSAAVISLVTGVATIGSGLVTNTPLVIAPATAVSIYFITNLQQYTLSLHSGNLVVMYCGITIVLLGLIGPLGRLISKLIPEYIQIGTTVGIGLITALSGYTELDIVVQGKYTLLAVGPITSEICIAISGLILIALGVYYHSRFAYLLGLGWGTFLWWSSQYAWPKLIGKAPQFEGDSIGAFHDDNGVLLTFEMIFLIILTLFGLAKALCELAYITTTFEAIPKGRLLLVIIGIANLASGSIYGPPVILSPETASGIKAGARTGLSAVVTGTLFLFSIFFAPFFTSIPAAATSPVLIMIGMILFQNVKAIDFTNKYGIAAFICLTLIPFTDSIIGGLGFGYATFATISFLNGDFKVYIEKFFTYYFGDESAANQGGRVGNNEEDMIQLPATASRVRRRVQKSNSNNDLAATTAEGNEDKDNEEKIERDPEPEPVVTRERRNSAIVVVERARRNTISLLHSVIADVDLENDIVRAEMTRY